jgi:hypothetical protein
MFYLFIQTDTITRVLEERSWWGYILYISGLKGYLFVVICWRGIKGVTPENQAIASQRNHFQCKNDSTSATNR